MWAPLQEMPRFWKAMGTLRPQKKGISRKKIKWRFKEFLGWVVGNLSGKSVEPVVLLEKPVGENKAFVSLRERLIVVPTKVWERSPPIFSGLGKEMNLSGI